MLVYCGSFDSMDGPVEITEDHIDQLILNHNLRLEKLTQLASDPAHIEKSMPPLQLDHSTSARDTVGRVVGKLSKGQYTRPDGETVPCLECDKVIVLGSDNAEKVADGRWSNVSIGADLDKGVLSELSITPFPAAENAALLAAKKNSELSQGDAMHEKLKKHLMKEHGMEEGSAEEMCHAMHKHLVEKLGMDHTKAAEHLSSMNEYETKALMKHLAESTQVPSAEKLSAEEEEKKKLAEKEEEEKKKLADDVKEDEKKNLADDVKEKEEKLSAARAKIITLSKGLKTGLKETKLKTREQSIIARVARLRSMAKITPAEQKKINLAELSTKPEAELDAFFKGYEIRENVIDARVIGTTRALSLAALKKETKEVRMSRLEAEGRKDMGMPMDEEQKKALADADPHKEMAQETQVPHDEMLKHLGDMLASYDQRDAVMAHVQKMMEMKHMSDMAPEQAESTEKQMSALAENVNRLQTQFQDLISLIGDTAGIKSEDLAE
jgi:hypothetical protein